MIVVLTDDSFYLLEMNSMEFMSLILENKGSITNIRAKSTMHFLKNDASTFLGFLDSKTSEIEACFCAYGDGKYSMKSVHSIDDLKYYEADNGKIYTCAEAYNIDISMKEPVSVKPNETQPEVTVQQKEKLNVTEEIPLSRANDEGLSTIIDENPLQNEASTEENASGAPSDVFAEEDIEPTKVTNLPVELKEKGLLLDTVLRQLSHIQEYFGEYIDIIRNYTTRNKQVFREIVTQSFLEEIALDNEFADSSTHDIIIKSTFGESTDLLDSMVNLPVFAKIISKRNLTTKFSVNYLYDSQYIKLCPIGTNEDGKLLGIIEIVELKDREVEEISDRLKERLLSEGRNFKKLSVKEKYEEWEEEAVRYFEAKSTNRSKLPKKIELIEPVIDKLKKQRYEVIDKVDEDSIMAWSSYDIISLDNRVLENNFPKSLSSQLEENYTTTNEQTIELEENDSSIDANLSTDLPRVIHLPESLSEERAVQEEIAEIVSQIKNEGGIRAGETSEIDSSDELGQKISNLIFNMASFVPTSKVTKVHSYTENGVVINPDSIDKLKEHVASRSDDHLDIILSNDQARTIFEGNRAVLSNDQVRLFLEKIEGSVTINGTDPLNPIAIKDEKRKR